MMLKRKIDEKRGASDNLFVTTRRCRGRYAR
jgi:hypothetical protein